MDKQFVPVPEYLTALGVGETELYDLIANGECAFIVFDEDVTKKNLEPKYYTSMPGCGSDWAEIALVPTMHCKECGQRMKVDDIPLPNSDWNIPGVLYHCGNIISYTCNCGMKYDDKNGWRYLRSEEE